jgi:hypothetical protein
MTISEKISNLLVCISFVFIFWVFVSWVDVIADNNQPAPEHSKYNFFVVITELWEDKNNDTKRTV